MNMRQIFRWFKNWFNRKHYHVWRNYKMLGNEGRTLFYCRKCACGTEQVQSAGLMGDGKWRDQNIPFSNAFEQEWFDTAKILEPSNDG